MRRPAIEENRALRSFNGLLNDDPKDYWGMKIQMPAWVDKVHNTKTGRCFILGTGPSLVTQLPLLSHLKEEETWTCNRMRKWGDLPFVPTHHVVTEPGPIGAWGLFVNPIYDFPAVPNRIAVMWWEVNAPDWLWCPKAPDDVQVRWQGTWGMGDYLPPVPTAWASPLTVTQLALWIGFTEIYLLGVDTTQTGQAFDPKYGRTQKARNITSILECAARMASDITRAGRKFVDCTPGGRLNQEGAVSYIPLEEVLEVSDG